MPRNPYTRHRDTPSRWGGAVAVTAIDAGADSRSHPPEQWGHDAFYSNCHRRSPVQPLKDSIETLVKLMCLARRTETR